jgi:hypothetical protein
VDNLSVGVVMIAQEGSLHRDSPYSGLASITILAVPNHVKGLQSDWRGGIG